jgi:aminopeptidase C
MWSDVLFFFFQIEHCNYFLVSMLKAAQAGDPVDGRLVSFLLKVRVTLVSSYQQRMWCECYILQSCI